VGVPLIAQVVLLMVNPVGRAGADEHEDTVLVIVGVTVEIAVLCRKLNGLPV
jgi:hypothetical protein